ncbi:uncharacterized protein B0H64DRAFT_113420 [Chaetomium fimeti]|uniref:Uncharacterized protein n=1 Tax=Chaetomium fimeti TaxID=1854472 RepID=A0AAE0HJT8_9PEZI|nr:hypothetical protein B0H64DRAFT_113420 [Chaetomium fimeti]
MRPWWAGVGTTTISARFVSLIFARSATPKVLHYLTTDLPRYVCRSWYCTLALWWMSRGNRHLLLSALSNLRLSRMPQSDNSQISALHPAVDLL